MNVSYQLYKWLDAAWRRRFLIIVPLVIFPILGLGMGVFAAKSYTGHTSMLIQETSKLNPFLEDFAVSSKLKERLSALQTLLHSRHILKQVAYDQNLINDKSTEVEQERVINHLSSSLRMEMTGKDLIRIQYSSTNLTTIQPILTTVSNYFIEQLLAPERSSMRDSSVFLGDLLATRKMELETSEQALAEFKNRHAEQLPELHLGNVSRLAQLKQRLFEREAELAGAKKSLGTINQQLSKTNPVIAKLEEQIISLQSKLALLRSRYTDEYSEIQGTLRILSRLKEERNRTLEKSENQLDPDKLWLLASNSDTEVDASQPLLLISQLTHMQEVRSRVDALTVETENLKKMISEQAERTSQLGALEKELTQLERDLSVKRDLYENLLKRNELARVTGSLGVFEKEKRIKIIDKPYTPSVPDTPSAMVFTVAGLFAGLCFGIGCTMLAEVNDNSLRFKKRIEEKLKVEVLTRIPQVQGFNVHGELIE